MSYDALIKALQPLTQRVRTDKTATKGARGQAWTDEPLTTAALRHHLNGGPARGVCPIKEGEDTTRVGLLDFDSHKGETPWSEMQAAAGRVCEALEARGLRPVPWRSSGGRGIHVYVLWDEPQDAYTVRQVLTEALADCGMRNGNGGVRAGQAEVFPKQDSVPVGGYGNQFILPLAGKSEPLDMLDLEPMGRDPGCIVWPSSAPLAKRDRPVREASSYTPEDAGLATQALMAITNDGSHPDEASRDWWFKVLCAAKEAGVSEGDAQAWSDRYGDSKPGDFEKTWRSITEGKEGGAPAAYLFTVAEAYGFHEHTRGEFDLVDTAAAEAEAEAQEAAKPLRYEFKPLGDLMRGRRLEWLVKGVLPKAQLGALYGASGSGKSFFAIDLAMCIARGLPWRGHRVKQTRVAYIIAEGADGFMLRVDAYARQHGIAEPNDVPMRGLTAAPDLRKAPDVKDLIRGIKAFGEVGLVIVDTLAQTTPGANENSSEDMSPAIKNCQAIHEATGAMVLLVHHSGKDAAKGMRGWSGMRGALDAELEVVRTATGRKVTLTKAKDGKDGTEWGFDLDIVTLGLDEDGDEITSCVVREIDVPTAKLERKLGPNEMVVNDVVQEFAKVQTAGIEVEAVIAEAARRMPEPVAGKRDTRRQHAKRALESLCSGDTAPYWMDGEGCLSVL